MIGSSSMDFSLSNFWRCWHKFLRGKKLSQEIQTFQYYLESNLFYLQRELDSGLYRHGGYRVFVVRENKKRTISVAAVRDRIVHRLAYEFLVFIYNRTFIFDVWSCRKEKGLTDAIERSQKFLNAYPDGYVWRADITKFFDNVAHKILIKMLERKVTHPKDIKLLKEIITSFLAVGANWERVKSPAEKASRSATLPVKFLQISTSTN